MMERRKQWTRILSVTLIACLFFSSTQTFAFSSKDLFGFDMEIPEINAEKQIKNVIINEFCSKVLKSGPFSETSKNNIFIYNPQQSVFVHLLCRNLGGVGSSYFGNAEDSYFLRDDLDELGFEDIITDEGNNSINLCDPASFDNDCNLAKHIPNLFNDIMNDYVNMKQPSLYGLNIKVDKDDKKFEEQINIFSSGYFYGIQNGKRDGIEICGSKDPKYPNTCKVMKSYMKNIRNVLRDNASFDRI